MYSEFSSHSEWKRMFDKILIANRGEIAVRIIRACREMGIRTVAVYSDVDRSALHVQIADEAVHIGPAHSSESYLNMKKILNAAKSTEAKAIHPGYGFLAENYQFAAQCEKDGIVFIGPDSRALNLVGDKISSRKRVSKIGIPIIPGMKAVCKDIEAFHEHAENIGYPVMIKASAGGGGKGMRIVNEPKHLKNSIEASMREAKSAFGNQSVYLEKYIEKPRHIEFQILADHHGNIIHLFERECSIQRRHQKIIEETPSSALDNSVRQKMGEAAIEVIRTTKYTNAGTVEFLLDENNDFYFLEVNARIQVEHPITEMVTGIDLARWQIRIAANEKLDIKQEEIFQRGHAIECRIYAEDPACHFLPSAGKILYMKQPEGPGIRVDSGIFTGYKVVTFYDPILAKLIVWGEDRETARCKMESALSDFIVFGIQTTIPFLMDVIQHPDFIAGKTYTNFIQRYFSDWSVSEQETFFNIAQIAAGIFKYDQEDLTSKTVSKIKKDISPWKILGNWRIGEN